MGDSNLGFNDLNGQFQALFENLSRVFTIAMAVMAISIIVIMLVVGLSEFLSDKSGNSESKPAAKEKS